MAGRATIRHHQGEAFSEAGTVLNLRRVLLSVQSGKRKP
jgi:hypothetical protein